MYRISCHKVFIAHYEHALADPRALIEPLSTFLELNDAEKTVIHSYLFIRCCLAHFLCVGIEAEADKARETAI